MRISRRWTTAAVVVAVLLPPSVGVANSPAGAAPDKALHDKTKAQDSAKPTNMTLDQFLDRVMMAESGGRDQLRNPLSTAVGPFQLIEGLFLELAQRHFASETAQLTVTQILALRTDRAFARRAAAAFTQDNAVHLARAGLPTTFQNLRLAYFAGPAGAARILRAESDAQLSALMSPAAMRANPFLRSMTAADLIAKSGRDIAADRSATAGLTPQPGSTAKSAGPHIKVRCNLGLASCQKWLALRKAKQRRQARVAEN